ncbi:hypothetical protein SORBI_3005G219800 [Sorghum bicolor]|uniref:Uncharacterized protein n=1 Tax=Sorghum bicolor TaxID=4558 RepID=A0A1B6PU08_SORBI|nr:hypothetical protein SORBI_3005G219800 [Sorghum bicolor]
MLSRGKKPDRERGGGRGTCMESARCLPTGWLSRRYRPRHRHRHRHRHQRRMQQRPGWMGGPLAAGRPEFIVSCLGSGCVCVGMGIYKFIP